MTRLTRQTSSLLLCALCLGVTTPAQALLIDLIYTGATPTSSADIQKFNDAQQGFNEAAGYWESLLSDDVTVRIDWDFASLGAGVLGQASSSRTAQYYTDVRSALVSDIKTSFDASAVSNLQSASTLTVVSNGETAGALDASVRIDNGDFEPYNVGLAVTQANAKALGLFSAHDTTSADGNIAFSSDFSWDFDASDGIAAGSFDFVGTAAHEIGHSLGFISGVDGLDSFAGPSGPGAPMTLADFEQYVWGSVLDLFRFSSDSVSRDLLDWAVGLAPDGSYPFFSIDGGLTALADFSTGAYNGDGWQASHWRELYPSLGIMDPAIAAGEFTQFKAVDVLAMDVIGWDLFIAASAEAPLPAALWLTVGGLLVMGWKRRRGAASQGLIESGNQAKLTGG